MARKIGCFKAMRLIAHSFVCNVAGKFERKIGERKWMIGKKRGLILDSEF